MNLGLTVWLGLVQASFWGSIKHDRKKHVEGTNITTIKVLLDYRLLPRVSSTPCVASNRKSKSQVTKTEPWSGFCPLFSVPLRKNHRVKSKKKILLKWQSRPYPSLVIKAQSSVFANGPCPDGAVLGNQTVLAQHS